MVSRQRFAASRPMSAERSGRLARHRCWRNSEHGWKRRCDRCRRSRRLRKAIRYALSRWRALTRYVDDGRIEIDNSAAERALRAVALGRKNYLFCGSDAGGSCCPSGYLLINRGSVDADHETTEFVRA